MSGYGSILKTGREVRSVISAALWVEDELTAVGHTASMLYWRIRVYLLQKPLWTGKGRRGHEESWLAGGRINGRGTEIAWGGLLEDMCRDGSAGGMPNEVCIKRRDGVLRKEIVT